MLEKLEYFLKVAELGSFRLASEELFMTQPALSSSIARFEAELGVKLFDRGSRGVRLTPIGEEIYPEVREICAHYRKLLGAVEEYREGSRNVINLGTAIRNSVLIVGQFMLENPNYSMMLSQYSSYNELKRALLNGVIDVSLCAPPVEGEGIEAQVIVNEALCVLMNKAHRLSGRSSVSLEELLGEQFLKLPESHPFNIQLTGIYKAAGLSEPPCVMHADADANALYISSKHGETFLTIMPVSRCKEFVSNDPHLVYVPLSESICYRSIGISRLKKNAPSRELLSFIDCMREYYSAEKFKL